MRRARDRYGRFKKGRLTTRSRATRVMRRHYTRRWSYRHGTGSALTPHGSGKHVKPLTMVLLAVGGYFLWTKFKTPTVALPAPVVAQVPAQDNSAAT